MLFTTAWEGKPNAAATLDVICDHFEEDFDQLRTMENLNENIDVKDVFPQADLNKVAQIIQKIAKTSHKILMLQVSSSVMRTLHCNCDHKVRYR